MLRLLAVLITSKIGKWMSLKLVVCPRQFSKNLMSLTVRVLTILLVRYFFYLLILQLNYILAVIKALATKLLAEDDYQMKCVEYFTSLSDDCKYIELEFPYFNLLFLVGYIILLGIQVICMLRHR